MHVALFLPASCGFKHILQMNPCMTIFYKYILRITFLRMDSPKELLVWEPSKVTCAASKITCAEVVNWRKSLVAADAKFPVCLYYILANNF